MTGFNDAGFNDAGLKDAGLNDSVNTFRRAQVGYDVGDGYAVLAADGATRFDDGALHAAILQGTGSVYRVRGHNGAARLHGGVLWSCTAGL